VSNKENEIIGQSKKNKKKNVFKERVAVLIDVAGLRKKS